MRIILTLLIFYISNSIVLGQTGIIKYDVDTSIFNKRFGDNYISDSISAKIICIKLPFTYDKSIEGFRHESNKKIVILFKDEYKIKNKRISYKKGKILEGDIESLIESYFIELDDKTTILLTGIYPSKYEQLLEKKIEAAAKSMRIV